MEGHPRNAWQEAMVAFGGPVAGGATAFGVMAAANAMDSQLLYRSLPHSTPHAPAHCCHCTTITVSVAATLGLLNCLTHHTRHFSHITCHLSVLQTSDS